MHLNRTSALGQFRGRVVIPPEEIEPVVQFVINSKTVGIERAWIGVAGVKSGVPRCLLTGADKWDRLSDHMAQRFPDWWDLVAKRH